MVRLVLQALISIIIFVYQPITIRAFDSGFKALPAELQGILPRRAAGDGMLQNKSRMYNLTTAKYIPYKTPAVTDSGEILSKKKDHHPLVPAG